MSLNLAKNTCIILIGFLFWIIKNQFKQLADTYCYFEKVIYHFIYGYYDNAVIIAVASTKAIPYFRTSVLYSHKTKRNIAQRREKWKKSQFNKVN